MLDDSSMLIGSRAKGFLRRKPSSGPCDNTFDTNELNLCILLQASCVAFRPQNICTQWWCRRVNIVAPSSCRLLASHMTSQPVSSAHIPNFLGHGVLSLATSHSIPVGPHCPSLTVKALCCFAGAKSTALNLNGSVNDCGLD